MPPDATSRWPRARPPTPAPMISTRSGVRVMAVLRGVTTSVGWGEREGQFVDHPVVPGELGFQPDEVVFEAQGLGAPQVGLGLGVEQLPRVELGLQRRLAVGERGDDRVRSEVGAVLQREVDGVGPQPYLAQGLVAQRVELLATGVGDRVDRAGGQVACAFGADRFDDALVGHPVQGAVERADLDVGPQLGAVGLSLAADLVAVHRPRCGEGAENEQPNATHLPTQTRVVGSRQ